MPRLLLLLLLLLLQEPIEFDWITLVLATKQQGPLVGKGISCVLPCSMGPYCQWLPQISISDVGELWGPQSWQPGDP